jgi:mannitol-specific phosphotransferase system IIBC component
MKLNSTVLLTLILLILMLGAGSVSAFWGFTLGSEALKGVTSPDARPTTKFASNKTSSTQGGAVTLLKEEEILKIVKARVEGKTKAAKSQKKNDNNQESNRTKQKPAEKPQEKAEEKFQEGFPITTQSEGVSFAVQSTRFSGGALLLRVKMENKGKDTVRFLYSFLDVTDDKGRTLSASTDGLPAELPTNGPTYIGTISIPTALLDDVKRISLALTDYPDQKLKLEVSDIPIER